MYQLKALIWQSYKVRARSPLSTGLDILGPFVIILAFLVLKAVLGLISVYDQNEVNQERGLFRGFQAEPLEPARDLPKHLCTKILFYSYISPTTTQQIQDNNNKNNNSDNNPDEIRTLILNQCGIQLIDTDSRDDLVSKLRRSLDDRISYKKRGADLNKYNSTVSCLTLTDNQTVYQAGIVIGPKEHQVELHLTDVVSNPIIYHPYTQGSAYNVFRFPHGDLNSGSYLLEMCISNAYEQLRGKQVTVDRFSLQSKKKCWTNRGRQKDATRPGSLPSAKFAWRIRAFPAKTGPQIIPSLFLVFQLVANFINLIATVIRITENNENGLHHYIRSAGVPAGIYWSSQMLIIIVHMTVQSLGLATLLAIPTSNILFDPIYDTTITMRWSLLLSYSLSVNAYGLLVGSLINKTSQGILVSTLLGVSYALYVIVYMFQWNPYTFTPYYTLSNLFLFNPVTVYEVMITIVYALNMTLNEPLDWSHLGMRMAGSGFSQWSLGELWLILIAQGFLWFLVTILIDQFRYSSGGNIFGFFKGLLNELLCCNTITPGHDNYSIDELKIKSILPSELKTKSGQSKQNPNRICCSLRDLSITGPNVLMAHSKGSSWKLSAEQLKRLDMENKAITKSHQLLVGRSQSSSIAAKQLKATQREEPIFLDDAVLQHIVWHKTQVSLENINLDFRFNQVSFILGQTNSKDLFFAALLGLRQLKSGFIVLDGVKYTSSTLALARPHIGFLAERDLFIPELTIFENLQFFGSLRDSSYTAFESESLFLLSLLRLMRRRNNVPQVLTSRSARKLALAVAAVGHTKLLLLVEPTLSLRWRPRCQVLNLLKKYKSIRSIIVDTSDVDEATAFGDRVVLLKNNQAYFDGSTERLNKKLGCGHWLVFEPTTGDGKTIPHESLRALEALTSEIFKHDKIEPLDPTTRSVYQELMKISSKESADTTGAKTIDQQSQLDSAQKSLRKSKLQAEELHKPTVILKVRQSTSSNQALCVILRKFANHATVNDFRLAELTYESLEDVLVMQMSRAAYPDIPPDLLLSLQHRINSNQTSTGEQDLISVRKWSSEIQVPKVSKSIQKANLKALFKDRLESRPEFLIVLGLMLLSLATVALSMWLLQTSLRSQQTTGLLDYKTSDDGSESEQISQVERVYKNRMGVYLVGDKSDNFNSTLSLFSRFVANKELLGFADRNMNKTDGNFVSEIVANSRDLLSSIVFLDPKSKEATIVFDSQLTHAMIAGIRSFLRHRFEFPPPRGEREVRQLYRSVKAPITSRFGFKHDWFEITGGFMNRRLFYGLGFAFAEGIAIGSLILAPVRHKSEVSVANL